MTKARSKAQKRRDKNAAKKPAQGQRGVSRGVAPKGTEGSTRPTPERRSRGVWSVTKIGMQDVAYDMIGRLGAENKLTAQQVETARLFQEVRAAYVAELGTVGYRSCLAGGSGGFDGGDGNPEAIRAYQRIEKIVGRVHIWALREECAKLADQKPWSLEGLRAALDKLGG